jgi:hypothetical protein
VPMLSRDVRACAQDHRPCHSHLAETHLPVFSRSDVRACAEDHRPCHSHLAETHLPVLSRSDVRACAQGHRPCRSHLAGLGPDLGLGPVRYRHLRRPQNRSRSHRPLFPFTSAAKIVKRHHHANARGAPGGRVGPSGILNCGWGATFGEGVGAS